MRLQQCSVLMSQQENFNLHAGLSAACKHNAEALTSSCKVEEVPDADGNATEQDKEGLCSGCRFVAKFPSCPLRLATYGRDCADTLTGSRKIEEVPDGNGNAVAHGRKSSSRVQHIGAKIGQLPSFVVAQASKAYSFRHLPRVCAVHSIYICPNGDLAGLEKCPDNGCRVVAAVALQRSDLSKHSV